jgi:hypothetical protein
MQPYGLPMTEETCARLPELLQPHGITVSMRPDLGEFMMLHCERDGVGVLLSVTKPAHWRGAGDVRETLMVVTVVGESLFRFWRMPRENRLRREIIELLRPHGWQG